MVFSLLAKVLPSRRSPKGNYLFAGDLFQFHERAAEICEFSEEGAVIKVFRGVVSEVTDDGNRVRLHFISTQGVSSPDASRSNMTQVVVEEISYSLPPLTDFPELNEDCNYVIEDGLRRFTIINPRAESRNDRSF